MLRAPPGDTSSLAGVQIRLVALSDSLRASVADACARYLRADSALTDARFSGGIGRRAASRARTLDRFRALDDSGAMLEQALLAALDTLYFDRTRAVVAADSAGAFRLTRIPPGRYALAAARRTTTVGEIWWREIRVEAGARARVEVDRPASGHLTCYDPQRRSDRLDPPGGGV